MTNRYHAISLPIQSQMRGEHDQRSDENHPKAQREALRTKKLFLEHRVWISRLKVSYRNSPLSTRQTIRPPDREEETGVKGNICFLITSRSDPRKLKFLWVDKSISSVGEGMKGMPFAGIVPVVKKVIMQKPPRTSSRSRKIQGKYQER